MPVRCSAFTNQSRRLCVRDSLEPRVSHSLIAHFCGSISLLSRLEPVHRPIETARQTAEVFGVNWEAASFINYSVLVLWIIDVGLVVVGRYQFILTTPVGIAARLAWLPGIHYLQRNSCIQRCQRAGCLAICLATTVFAGGLLLNKKTRALQLRTLSA